MKTVTVRLNEYDAAILSALVRAWRTDQSEALRRLLREHTASVLSTGDIRRELQRREQEDDTT